MSDFDPSTDASTLLLDDSTGKRKQQPDNPVQARAKRQRYISIACSECKRRKIKCNGETPCHRCGNLQLDCEYAPNHVIELKSMTQHMERLENQIDLLWGNLNALRSTLGQELPVHPLLNFPTEHLRNIPQQQPQASMVIDPALSRNRPNSQQSHFQGPTSAGYSFDVARSSLQSMGITANDDTPDSKFVSQDISPSASPRQLHPAIEAIVATSKDEALRLCNAYEDEMGTMYPILDMPKVVQYASLVFGLGDAAIKTGLLTKPKRSAGDAMADEDTDILRLILANALVTEANGSSQLAKRLFFGVSQIPESGSMALVTMKTIQITTLIAMYHFHSDNESLSWRVIGLAARLCLETGLHRSETYTSKFATEEERSAALKLFWSVYVLDRRWSLGIGMSFALRDADIDSKLPKPTDAPYLTAMIAYSQIGSKVWDTMTTADTTASNNLFSNDETKFLDFQVQEWLREIPQSLSYVHPSSTEYATHSARLPNDPEYINANAGRAMHRLRLVLYLRANQMRILIHKPVLHSATSMLANASSNNAQTVVDVAKDTIRVLCHTNKYSDLYRTQQMCFNYFLLSALSVLFLAVSHAPLQFADKCRDEYYMALELVRGLATESAVSKRLWRMIRGLRDIGPKLGLHAKPLDNGSSEYDQRSPQSPHDAHNSAAMAMAGLAGHPIDESAFFAAHQQGVRGSGLPALGDGNRNAQSLMGANAMASDLASLFEAAGAFGPSGGEASSANQGDGTAKVTAVGPTQGGASMAWGNEEEFGRIMRDLF